MENKIIPLILLCFFILQKTQAQKNIEVENISTIEIEENLSFEKDKKIAPVFDPILVENYSENIFKNPRIEILNGDLILGFHINSNSDGFLEIDIEKIENLTTGMEFPLHKERLYGDIGRIKIKSKKRKKKEKPFQIIIANNASNINPLLLTGDIKIRITIKHFNYRQVTGRLGTSIRCFDKEDINISNKIKGFGFKKGYGFQITGGVLSILTVGGGFLLEDKALDIYENDYKLNHTTKNSAEDDYKKANKKYRNSTDIKNVGIVIGAATATWWLLQKLYLNERKRIYDCKCFDCAMFPSSPKKYNIELFNPSINPSQNDLGNGIAGIGIRLNF